MEKPPSPKSQKKVWVSDVPGSVKLLENDTALATVPAPGMAAVTVGFTLLTVIATFSVSLAPELSVTVNAAV